MKRTISRRDVLRGTAIAAGGLVAGCGSGNDGGQPVKTAPSYGEIGVSEAWAPGPKPGVERDLTPGTTTVRLGSPLSIPRDKPIGEVIAAFRKKGFTGTALGPNPWIDAPESRVRELRDALAEHDVVIFEVAGYTNMIHPDPATREKNLTSLSRAIEAAERVGCPMVGTITGGCDPVNFFNVHPDNWTEETWRLTVESIRRVLKDTAGMKAAIGIEAQVTTNLDGPVAHRRLIDDVGDPRCAVNLDPVNMISLATYYHTTELLNDCFDLLGESILGCHAKDTYIWPDQQTVHVQEVCAGRGVMDYETYLVRMSRLKWPRTIFPEHIPADQYPEAHAFIRKVAENVGVTIHGS